MTLGNLLKVFEFHCPRLQSGDKNADFIESLMWKVNEIIL